MSAIPIKRISSAEYLALDRAAEARSDYYHGEMFAMAGASKTHNRIVRNLLVAIENQLRKNLRRCEAFSQDMRVEVDAERHYSCPDIVAVCGKFEFLDDQEDTLLNPTMITEVLSDSTEGYDRGLKFENYWSVPSLQEYVLVSQHRPLVQRFLRQADNKWLLTNFESLSDVAVFTSVDVAIPLAEIYLDVEFPAEPPIRLRTDADGKKP